MSAEEKYLKMLEKTGALLSGHFLLSSGLHSDKYVQCAKLLQFPDYASSAGADLAEFYKTNTVQMPDFVASPAIGGIVIGQEVAKSLGVRHIFIEKDETGKPTLRRGFEIKAGESFIVVEDVVTTGKSTNEVLKICEQNGAKSLAMLSIINRTGSFDSPLGIPFFSLIALDLKAYQPQSCPLCEQKIPVVKPGSRKQ